MALEATKVRLQQLLDERATITKLDQEIIAKATSRENSEFTEVESTQRAGYRERSEAIDAELEELNGTMEREEAALKTSKLVRAHLVASHDGVTLNDDDEVVYRTFGAFARDSITVRFGDRINGNDRKQVEAARERLQRAPQHTLTEDIPGLTPPQHIAQIMDVIDASRPVIVASRRATLNRMQLQYPTITQRPEVLIQASEKSEGGTKEMIVGMGTVDAQTFIGGGNLSWQAIEFSTPSALDLWFQLQGEAYARKTEGTACAVLEACAAAGGTAGNPATGGTADTFADVIVAAVGGAAAVYANSGAMADTLYVSPDVYFQWAALTTDTGTPFITAGNLNLGTFGGSIGGLRVIASHGFSSTTAIVGDSSAFIVAENAGAPVQLRAVEPAIGGLEVGLIGVLAAACVDPSRFALAI